MKYPNDLPAVLTYGGGTNSSAILVELIKRKYEPPELIIFADTGAEMPHTYAHIKIMSEYATKHGYPAITVVRNEQPSKHGGIYEYCITNRMLPGVAYGHKNCSVQFKIEPVQKLINEKIGPEQARLAEIAAMQKYNNGRLKTDKKAQWRIYALEKEKYLMIQMEKCQLIILKN